MRLADLENRMYLHPMEIECTFICSYCLQINSTMVDGSAGHHQEYIEDCQVCCRSNRLVIDVDEHIEEAAIASEPA